MSDRALAWTLRGIVATGAVFGVVGSVLLHLGGHSGLLWSKFGVHNALGGLFLAVIVWLACGRQPRNKAVWSIALVSLGGFYVAGLAAAAMLVDDPSRFLDFGMAPADIPPAAAWIMVFAVPAGSIGWYSMATLGVLLFPDGRLPSSRWRGVALLAAAGVALSGLGQQRPIGSCGTTHSRDCCLAGPCLTCWSVSPQSGPDQTATQMDRMGARDLCSRYRGEHHHLGLR